MALNKQVVDTDLKASTIIQWIQELKDTFVNELIVLSEENVALKVNCGILTERLKVLEDVEKQLKGSVEADELDVDAVFLPKADVTELMNDVVETGNKFGNQFRKECW